MTAAKPIYRDQWSDPPPGTNVASFERKPAMTAAGFEGEFSFEHLVIRAWLAYPEAFGMTAMRFPDTKKVSATLTYCLAPAKGHKRGCTRKGWIELIGPKSHRGTRAMRLTKRGVAELKRLNAKGQV